MTPLRVGDRAPDFTLPASTGEKVTLSEELRKGPVVVAWYLFDFGRV
jgi:peroxiredoxin Q/BCP